MKKIMVILMAMMLLLTSCGMFAKPIPATESVNIETSEKVVETQNAVESLVEDTTVDIVQETNISEESVAETENQENNDFYGVLDAIKEVHPGTAGSSLKVMYAAYKFLNSCKVRLPFDKIAADWVEKQKKEDYSDINESFNFVFESLDNFKGDKIKDLLKDAGIELPNGVSFEGIIEEAKQVLNVIIEKTKQ